MSTAFKEGRRRVLVTGFGAFPGAPQNPTAEIARRIGRSRRLARLGINVATATLPVVFAGAESRLSGLIEATRPDAILHLGLAARRPTLCVETRALNRIGTLHPDASRRVSAVQTIIAGGPAHIASRWPAARLCAAMRATGVATHLSNDAGDYVCNQTLYLTLAHTGLPAGFIHAPPPRRANSPRSQAGAYTIGDMTRAVEAAILMLVTMARHDAVPSKMARISRRNSHRPEI